MMSPRPTIANTIALFLRLTYLGIAAVLTVMLIRSVGYAQTFVSGSTGVDGALDFSGVAAGTTILFNPATFNPPLDQDNDNVYHFTTITIPQGVTVRLSAQPLGFAPVIWLASGAVQISGFLDLNGQNGHPNFPSPPIPAVPGAGGYGGGAGRRSNSAAQPGSGPGGGQVSGGNGGGGGHAGVGGGAGGAAYGNDFLMPLLGGSGGAGGTESDSSCGGGAGGGALLIASSVSITVNELISANGGSGGSGGCGFSGNGGGGSGGAIRLMAPIISGSGQITAYGGGSSGSGHFGSRGRIRFEAFQHSFSGNVDPTPNFVTPGLVFPPVSGPSVRVVRVGGVAVPARPMGSFVAPDVSLDNAAAVTIEIEARNIPLGTVVRLTIDPETGPSQTVDSTPLVGTRELSTATATVTLPHGFSRFFVQANWTP